MLLLHLAEAGVHALTPLSLRCPLPDEGLRPMFPMHMEVEWLRVYQDPDDIRIGCDPEDAPTAEYIDRSVLICPRLLDLLPGRPLTYPVSLPSATSRPTTTPTSRRGTR